MSIIISLNHLWNKPLDLYIPCQTSPLPAIHETPVPPRCLSCCSDVHCFAWLAQLLDPETKHGTPLSLSGFIWNAYLSTVFRSWNLYRLSIIDLWCLWSSMRSVTFIYVYIYICTMDVDVSRNSAICTRISHPPNITDTPTPWTSKGVPPGSLRSFHTWATSRKLLSEQSFHRNFMFQFHPPWPSIFETLRWCAFSSGPSVTT